MAQRKKRRIKYDLRDYLHLSRIARLIGVSDLVIGLTVVVLPLQSSQLPFLQHSKAVQIFPLVISSARTSSI